MSNQRPFFANFMAAFRAHSSLQQQATKSLSTASGVAPSSQTSHSTSATANSNSQPSNPRSIATKSGGTAGLTQIHSPRSASASPLSTSPGADGTTSPSNGYMSPRNGFQSSDRMRRGSDSSSEGFRDVLGAEKWYIGGRTATGEERVFKLGVIKRNRSIDRLSLDRLSL